MVDQSDEEIEINGRGKGRKRKGCTKESRLPRKQMGDSYSYRHLFGYYMEEPCKKYKPDFREITSDPEDFTYPMFDRKPFRAEDNVNRLLTNEELHCVNSNLSYLLRLRQETSPVLLKRNLLFRQNQKTRADLVIRKVKAKGVTDVCAMLENRRKECELGVRQIVFRIAYQALDFRNNLTEDFQTVHKNGYASAIRELANNDLKSGQLELELSNKSTQSYTTVGSLKFSLNGSSSISNGSARRLTIPAKVAFSLKGSSVAKNYLPDVFSLDDALRITMLLFSSQENGKSQKNGRVPCYQTHRFCWDLPLSGIIDSDSSDEIVHELFLNSASFSSGSHKLAEGKNKNDLKKLFSVDGTNEEPFGVLRLSSTSELVPNSQSGFLPSSLHRSPKSISVSTKHLRKNSPSRSPKVCPLIGHSSEIQSKSLPERRDTLSESSSVRRSPRAKTPPTDSKQSNQASPIAGSSGVRRSPRNSPAREKTTGENSMSPKSAKNNPVKVASPMSDVRVVISECDQISEGRKTKLVQSPSQSSTDVIKHENEGSDEISESSTRYLFAIGPRVFGLKSCSFRCIWCNNCESSAMNLILHYRTFHQRYLFSYTNDQKTIFLKPINDENRVVQQKCFTFVRKKTSRVKLSENDLLECLDKLFDNDENTVLKSRDFFSSRTGLYLPEYQQGLDSDDEDCNLEWQDQHLEDQVNDFVDVLDDEKHVINLWNKHRFRYSHVSGDSQVGLLLRSFLRDVIGRMDSATLTDSFLGCLALHILSLYNFACIDLNTLQQALTITQCLRSDADTFLPFISCHKPSQENCDPNPSNEDVLSNL